MVLSIPPCILAWSLALIIPGFAVLAHGVLVSLSQTRLRMMTNPALLCIGHLLLIMLWVFGLLIYPLSNNVLLNLLRLPGYSDDSAHHRHDIVLVLGAAEAILLLVIMASMMQQCSMSVYRLSSI